MEYQDKENQHYLNDLNIYLSKKYKSRARLRQILKIYQIMGILLLLFGVLYFLITSIDFDLTKSQLISIIIGGTGITLSVLSKLMNDYLKTKDKETEKRRSEIEQVSEYIFTWTLFEKSMRMLIGNRQVNINKHSFRGQMEFLYESKIIGDKDFLMLERALEFRNMIVHEGIIVSPSELKVLTDLLNSIIDRINNAHTHNNI